MPRTMNADQINRALHAITSGPYYSIPDFLHRLKFIDMRLFNTASGRYTPTDEGRVHLEVDGTGLYLSFGWYALQPGRPRVEWAYVS